MHIPYFVYGEDVTNMPIKYKWWPNKYEWIFYTMIERERERVNQETG